MKACDEIDKIIADVQVVRRALEKIVFVFWAIELHYIFIPSDNSCEIIKRLFSQ